MPKGEKNAVRIKNETPAQRGHRMRGVTISDEEVKKNAIPAPSPDKIHALLTNGGRPPCFETEADLTAAIEDYFNSCLTPIIDEQTGVVTGMRWWKKPTLGGLAIHLGCTRETIWNYGKSDRYFNTIKKAKDIITNFTEELLIEGKNPVGAINTLVNLRVGWVADEKTIKVEPVMPDNGAKTTDEITAFLDERALPEGKI
jgi:hypothetical protein